MSVITHLSDPKPLLKHIYTGGATEVWANVFVSFSKNLLNVTALPHLINVRTLLLSESPDDILTSLAVSSDGMCYCFSKSAKAYQVDLREFALTSSVQTPHQQMVSLSAVDKYLATASPDLTVRIYERESIQQVKALKLTSIPMQLLWASPSKLLVICQAESFVYDVFLQQITTLPSVIPVSACVVGEHLIMLSCRDNTIQIFDTEQNATTQSTFMNERYYSIMKIGRFTTAISAEGRLVFFPQQLEIKKGFVCEDIYTSVHPADTTLLQCSQNRSTSSVDEWNMEVQNNPTNIFVGLHQFQQFIILTDAEHNVYVLDTATLQIVGKQMHVTLFNAAHGELGEILTVRKIDDQYLAVGCSSNKLVIINRQTSAQQLLFGQAQPITQICVQETPIGQIIIAGSSSSIRCYVKSEKVDDPFQVDQKTLTTVFGTNNLRVQPHLNNSYINCVELLLTGQTQLTSMCFFATEQRQLLAYAADTHIHLVELTKLLGVYSKSGSLVKLNAEDVQTTVSAHLQSINDLQITEQLQLISTSADKSIGMWALSKQPQQAAVEQKVTVYDIFTNKVNRKFNLSIDKTNERLRLMKHLPNAARRAIWGVSLSRSERVFAVACGDLKVRLYQYTADGFSPLKVFEDFQSAVVRAEFVGDCAQILCLQNDGVVKLVNVASGEVQAVVDIKTVLQKEESDRHFRKNRSETEYKIELGTFQIIVDGSQFIIGTSTGQLYLIFDATADVQQEKLAERQEKIQLEQRFLVQLDQKDYKSALITSLVQKNDRQAIRVFHTLHAANQAMCSLEDLTLLQLKQCVEISRDWLRVNKRAQYGAELLHQILKTVQVEVLVEIGCKKDLEDMLKCLDKQAERVDQEAAQAELLAWM